MKFDVDNIKCGGCGNSIRKRLLEIDSIDEVVVDPEQGQVEVSTTDDSARLRQQVLAALVAMGYPEKGSLEGLGSIKAKATSYVSCAIGKMSD